jgi:hypothetical protein
MNKILNRPMFQRQRFAPGGNAKKIFNIKRPFSSGIAVLGDKAKKINQWDKGIKVNSDGSWNLKSKPHTGFKKFIIPNRKSLKTAYAGAIGTSMYDLIAPEPAIETQEEVTVDSQVIDKNNNVINKKIIENKANSITDTINNIKNDAVTAITGGNEEAEINGTETFQGANILSSDIFATKNEEVEAAETNPENKMDMNLKISPLANGATNYAEQEDITQIDMGKVNAIKEQLNQLVGDTSNSDNINMLFQLGSALMSGQTLKGGLAGFLDVAGQAGLQILPQMLAVSDRKRARDQEIALAAFELVQEATNKDDAFGPGKGTMVYPHQIQYQMTDDGQYALDENNQFIPIGYTPVGSGFGFSKDYQSQGMMNANSVLTSQGLPPMYTLLDAATTGAAGAFGANEVSSETPGSRDADKKYARVLERGLPAIADMLQYITTLGDGGTFNSDKYIGPAGILFEKTRNLLAPWEQIASMAPFMGNSESEVMGNMAKNYQQAFELVDEYWMANMDTENGRLVDIENLDKLNKDGTFTDTQGVYAGQTYTFRDQAGNLQTGQTKAGDVYETPLSLKLKIGAQASPWDNSNIGLMEQYKNQIGMVVARYKQPTGRLLADTIRDSKNDIDLTQWKNPNDLVNKQFRYFKNFLVDWNRSLEAANEKVTAELIDKRFGAPDGSGGGLAKINNAIMSYNMWGQIKEAQSPGSVVLPATETWIKLPGLIYPGAPKPGGGVYNTQDIRDLFTEGLQSGSLGKSESNYGTILDDETNIDEYIDEYFESLKD